MDPFRYALTGTKNSSIKVKLARVKANDTTGDVVESVVTLDHVLPTWTEYVTRLGWLDKVHVYIVASNRLQNHVALLRVNTETNQTAILYEEKVKQKGIGALKKKIESVSLRLLIAGLTLASLCWLLCMSLLMDLC